MSEYGIIDGVDFINEPAEKYWSFPKSYKGNSKEETKTMILSGNYIGSSKQDGHYARFIKDMNGNMRLQGRSESVNGGYLNKIEWVPQCNTFFNSLPNGTVLLGELYFPSQRGSRKVTTILGCLKDRALERQEKGEKLHYYIFDIWAYNGKSYLNTKIEERVNCLQHEFCDLCDEYVECAKYTEGEELWNNLGAILAEGGEGIVITQKGSIPSPGKRTARKTLKVKMEIEQTVDVFLDGAYKEPTMQYNGKFPETWLWWYNEKTGEKVAKNMYVEYSKGAPWTPITKAYYYSWASAVSISVMRAGKPYHLGWISGIPDNMKSGIINTPEKYKNQVYEITCMEIEKKKNKYGEIEYSLRHGKFVVPRPDKKVEDCDFSQIA